MHLAGSGEDRLVEPCEYDTGSSCLVRNEEFLGLLIDRDLIKSTHSLVLERYLPVIDCPTQGPGWIKGHEYNIHIFLESLLV
jgi:hypothetical protein